MSEKETDVKLDEVVNDEDSFEDDLLDAAAEFGVDPDAYPSEDKLEEAVFRAARERAVGKSGSDDSESNASPKDTKDDNTGSPSLEAYKLNLDSESFDSGLRKELQKFSDDQATQFQKVLGDIQKTHRAEISGLRAQLDQIHAADRGRAQAEDLRSLDRWIAKGDDRKEYFGDEDSVDIEPATRHGRRRVNVMDKVYRLADTYRNNKERIPATGKLFAMAFATMSKGRAGGKKSTDESNASPKGPTRTARPTGSGGTDKGKPLNEEERIEKAGKTVAKWQADREAKFTRSA